MENEKELVKLFQEELKTFVEKSNFLTKENVDLVISDFRKDMEAKFGDVATKKDFEKLSDDVTAEIAKNQNKKSENTGEDFKKQLHDAIKNFNTADPYSKSQIVTTQKAVYSTSIGSDTGAMRIAGVGEIRRGVPYVRNLLNVVPMGADNHGAIRWYEQATVTNNAANAAEVRNAAGMSESGITWAEKNLTGKRIHDYIKVGVDQIKDVSFVEGEVRRLIERNMRLKENDQLINGTGTVNEIAGLLSYATAFDTDVDKIAFANLIDLIGKGKTQIDTDMLGAAMPNVVLVNRVDVDSVRYKKTEDGAYLFPNLALGTADLGIGGLSVIENPLITANTLLMGDFSLANLYVWDDLIIEMYFEGTDKRDGLITIGAYMRENLRVQDVDKKAFVKVADIASDIRDISIPEG